MKKRTPIQKLYRSMQLFSQWMCLLSIYCLNAHSSQTNHLQLIKQKILQLKSQIIHHQHDISATDKQLRQKTRQIQQLQQNLLQTQQQITEQKQHIQQLENQYQRHQEQLRQHIKTRYQYLSPNITQQRNFTYYQYILQSDVKLLNQLTLMRNELKRKHEVLEASLQKQISLRNQLKQQQHDLLKHKIIKQTSLHKTEHILHNEQAALNQLIQKIAERPFQNVHIPLAKMHGKWPWPIQKSAIKYTRSNQGLFLSTPEGEPIHAILPGKILFSRWFNGYGYLIIIDHGRGYYSLYGNNRALSKSEGSYVVQNEIIASAGHSGNIKKNGLYFELRHKGKTISPLPWMA